MTDSHEPAGEQTTNKGREQTDARMVTFRQRIRHLVDSPNWLDSVRLVTGVFGAIVGAIVLLWLIDKIVFYYVARSYVDEVAKALDLNLHLANALIILTFVVAIFFARFLWSFSKQRRIVGISGLAGLLIAHSLVLWWATRDQIIDKCYVISRNGNVTYREHPGIDPATGRECRPVTPAMVERLRKYQAGERPERVVSENPAFFDVVSGEPIIWYYQSKEGMIEIFDLMGFHPDTGEELIPITKDISALWKKQQLELLAKRNTIIGKCYVISRDGNVTYREQAGIDPATGRECRPVTPEMVERLRDYQAGKRPQRVAAENPEFFDPRSGEPIIWYYQSKEGMIEIFDLMGFHPDTGEELIPITKDISALWKKQQQRAPKRITDPENYVFFDPKTGAPRAWYWISSNGLYEFYDNQGFQQQTGDKFQVVTREIVNAWKDQQKTTPTTPLKAPNRVQITADTVFFDPVTGNPRLWYWRKDKGEYEFFDGPGFHPQNGQPLQSFHQRFTYPISARNS
jgi:hypothetical protein